MVHILQRYVSLPQTKSQYTGLKVSEALLKNVQSDQDEQNDNQTNSCTKKCDISDIRLDRAAQYYLPVSDFAKTESPQDDGLHGANIINNEEDNPHLNDAKIIDKEMRTKITGYLPNGTPIREYVDIWNDRGYQGSEDLDYSHSGDCFFFHASTDFLMDAAKKYATISDEQEFKYRLTQDRDFVQSAIEFLKGEPGTKEEVQSAQKQMDTVVRELADRIKNGESTDLHTLNSKITIAGTDMSVGNLLDIRQSLNDFEDTMKLAVSSNGSNDLGQFGKLGMLKPLIHVYAQSLSEGLQKGIEQTFSHVADEAFQKAVDFQEDWHTKTVEKYGQSQRKDTYYSSNAYYGTLREDIYHLFSSLDTSSAETMKTDFENKLGKFASLTEVLDKACGDNATARYISNLRTLFNKVSADASSAKK